MAVTDANAATRTYNEPAKVKIVNHIPALEEAEVGEMFLRIADSDTHDKKLLIRVATGRLRVALA